MKLLTKAVLLSAVTLFAGAASAGSKFVASDANPESKMCVLAGEGSRIQFISTARNNHFPLKLVAQEIECNGENITNCAKIHGNKSVYATLSKYNSPRVEIYRDTAVSK